MCFLGKTAVTNKRIIGVSNFSPIEVDSHIDKTFIRTTDPTSDADVLYTHEPVYTTIPVVIVFNDEDYLNEWGLEVVDKDKKIDNSLIDKWVKIK